MTTVTLWVGDQAAVTQPRNQAKWPGLGENALLLTDSMPMFAVPAGLKVCVIEEDLASALIAYFPLLMEKELDVHLLEPASAWAHAIQQQLPQALETLNYLQLRQTYAHFVEQALLNAGHLRHPLIQHSTVCEGRTAVVLGAAPSVVNYFDWLKTHRDTVVVYAVARLAKRLLNEGIRPDFWVASDPTEAAVAHAECLEPFLGDSVLIVQHYAAPTLLDIWPGALLYWGPRWPQQSQHYQTELNVEIEGGTVANLALLSALGMGCRRVLCAGMDFCYDDSGATHESSSLEATLNRKSNAADQTRFDRIENYHGDFCATTPEFLEAVSALPQQLETLMQRYGLPSGFELINLNPKAAKIAGVVCQSLDEVTLLPASRFDIRPLIETLTLDEPTERKQLQSTLATLQRGQKHYRNVTQLAKKGQALFAQTAPEAMHLEAEAMTFLQRVEKQYRKLEKSLKEDQAFVQRYGFYAYSPVIQQAKVLQASPYDRRAHYDYFKASFKAYAQIASDLAEIHQKAARNIQFKLDELKNKTDFEALATLWLSWNRPYRFLGWQQKWPGLAETVKVENASSYQMLMESLMQWQADAKVISTETYAYLSANPHRLKPNEA
ncbi:MAG: 6-hydroxymethylpterin diphosphokinase MptE-like protein [Hydrogenovibrio sp.]